MKPTLLKGDHHLSPPPHPTIYKRRIMLRCDSRPQTLTYIGPIHLALAGWCVVMSPPAMSTRFDDGGSELHPPFTVSLREPVSSIARGSEWRRPTRPEGYWR